VKPHVIITFIFVFLLIIVNKIKIKNLSENDIIN
jgi:hypothetical protein